MTLPSASVISILSQRLEHEHRNARWGSKARSDPSTPYVTKTDQSAFSLEERGQATCFPTLLINMPHSAGHRKHHITSCFTVSYCIAPYFLIDYKQSHHVMPRHVLSYHIMQPLDHRALHCLWLIPVLPCSSLSHPHKSPADPLCHACRQNPMHGNNDLTAFIMEIADL